MDQQTFTDAMSSFPSGVTIVTAVDSAGKMHGLTLSAFSSVSAEPPLIMISLMDTSNTLDVIRTAGAFSVNFLSDDAEELARRFASKGDEKFEGTPVSFREIGGPIFHDHTCAFISCEVEQTITVADHVILFGRVREAAVDPMRSPMIYGRRQFSSLTPNADTVTA